MISPATAAERARGPRRLLVALLLFSLLVIAIGTWNSWRDVGRPFGGFLTYYNPQAGAWQVDPATPPWWTGVAGTGLEGGDSVTRLNVYPYDRNVPALYELAGVGARLPVEYWADGDYRFTSVEVVTFSASHFLEIMLPDLIIGLCFWLLALLAFRAHPDNPLNRIFAATMAWLAINRALSYQTLFRELAPLNNALDLLATVLFSPVAGAMFFHFALTFPTPIRRFRRPLLVVAYGVGLTIAAVYGASRFLLWTEGQSDLVGQLDGMAFRGMIRFYTAGLMAIVARLLWMALSSRPRSRQRRQAAIILGGLALSSPYILNTLALNERSFFWQHLDLRYLYLALPTALAYAIVRYQTFRSSSPLFLSVLMLATSALAASLAASALYAMNPAWLATQRMPLFPPLFVATLLLATFWGSQPAWRLVFGRWLRWNDHGFEVAHRLGTRVFGEFRSREPARVLAQLVREEMGLDLAQVWEWEEAAGQWRCTSEEAPAAPLPAAVAALRPGDFEGQALLRVEPTAEGAGPALVAPLRGTERMVGLLVVGKRWDEEIFDHHDARLVEMVAAQTGLFLQVARQIETLRRMPLQIAEGREAERRQIAEELHDTIQQFLGALPYHLDQLLIEAEENPAAAEALLDYCLGRIEEAAKQTRQIQRVLNPTYVEVGLRRPLEDLADRYTRFRNLPVTLDLPPDLDEGTTRPMRESLFRIVDQALENVARHASATRAHVRFECDEREIRFAIEDDGVGIDPAKIEAARREGHLGIEGMRSRLTMLGGSFAVGPTGAGTRVSGALPLDSSAA